MTGAATLAIAAAAAVRLIASPYAPAAVAHDERQGIDAGNRIATPTRPAAYITSDGRVRIVGYNDMREMLSAITTRIETRRPGLRFDLELHSTKSAPPALLSGASLLAPMGAEMARDQRAAFRERWCNAPVEFRIAHDSLRPGALSSPSAFIVRDDNPLRAIDIQKARLVFGAPHGEPIARWGELGLSGAWAARPIHPVGLAADTAIGRFALRGPLASRSFVAGLRGEHQSRDVASAVLADPLAIGFANLNHAAGKLRALTIVDTRGIRREPDRATVQSGRYPLDRFLLVYARRRCDGHLDPLARLVLAAILSDAGQAIIASGNRGYIPLNRRERDKERQKLRAMDRGR